jgi:phage-related minor tail protein
MSSETEGVNAAVSKLTSAMSELIRAIDAVGDETLATADVPDTLPEQLERLAARLNVAGGFGA